MKGLFVARAAYLNLILKIWIVDYGGHMFWLALEKRKTDSTIVAL